MNNLQIQHAERFIEKLRKSSKFQITGALHKDGCFCAEGLLCDQMIEDYPQYYSWSHTSVLAGLQLFMNRRNADVNSSNGPSRDMYYYIGFLEISLEFFPEELKQQFPYHNRVTLIHMNDRMGLTFPQIADVLENFVNYHKTKLDNPAQPV